MRVVGRLARGQHSITFQLSSSRDKWRFAFRLIDPGDKASVACSLVIARQLAIAAAAHAHARSRLDDQGVDAQEAAVALHLV